MVGSMSVGLVASGTSHERILQADPLLEPADLDEAMTFAPFRNEGSTVVLCLWEVAPMTSVTKLLLSNPSQAARIPAHLRLPDSVKVVEVRASGHERIISPVDQRWGSFFSWLPRCS